MFPYSRNVNCPLAEGIPSKSEERGAFPSSNAAFGSTARCDAGSIDALFQALALPSLHYSTLVQLATAKPQLSRKMTPLVHYAAFMELGQCLQCITAPVGESICSSPLTEEHCAMLRLFLSFHPRGSGCGRVVPALYSGEKHRPLIQTPRKPLRSMHKLGVGWR